MARSCDTASIRHSHLQEHTLVSWIRVLFEVYDQITSPASSTIKCNDISRDWMFNIGTGPYFLTTESINNNNSNSFEIYNRA